jgi:uncharacterized membrane protein
LKTSVKEILSNSERSLSGKWGQAIMATLLYLICAVGVSLVPFVGTVLSVIISGPLSLGISGFFLRLIQGNDSPPTSIFDGFRNFGTAFAAYLISSVLILLWCLLLIIPGIIAGLSYSLTFYILAEEPNLSAMDAINKSKAMMEGHKMRLFVLCLVFVGMSILCLFTLGIGFIWLLPYISTVMTNFYLEVKVDESQLSLYSREGSIDMV